MQKDRTGKIQGLQFCKSLFKDSRFQFALSSKGFRKHYFAALTKFYLFQTEERIENVSVKLLLTVVT